MKKLIPFITAGGYFLASKLALAQISDTVTLGNAQHKGLVASTPLQSIVSSGITIIFTIAGLMVLVFLIYGAFQWVTSGGAKEKVDNARKTITSALVGLLLLGLAFVIVRIVGQIVGFDILQNLTLPPLGTPAT